MTLTIVVPVWKDHICMRPFWQEVKKHVPEARIVWVIDPPHEPFERLPDCEDLQMDSRRGQEACMMEGIRYAIYTSDMIAIMDVDLQDPPSLLPRMVEAIEAGYDIAWPVHPTASGRSFLYRILSQVWYWVMAVRAPGIPRYANTFCMMTQAVARRVAKSPHPWVRKAIATSIGIKEIPFHRPDRTMGETKYSRLGRDFPDAVRKLFS